MSSGGRSPGGIIPMPEELSGYLRVIETLLPDGTIRCERERVLSRDEVKMLGEQYRRLAALKNNRVSHPESDTATD